MSLLYQFSTLTRALWLVCTFGMSSAAWSAPAYPLETAGQVADVCEGDESNPSQVPLIGVACVFKIEGFLDGYRQGTARGALVAAMEEMALPVPEKEVEGLRKRIRVVADRAQCLPPSVKTREVIVKFVAYVKHNPRRRNEHYSAVLRDAIESSYRCVAPAFAGFGGDLNLVVSRVMLNWQVFMVPHPQ